MAARGLGAAYQGMNWASPRKRLAIYLRDGLACAYCAATVEEGARLTLDHLTPHRRGVDNRARNLITACVRCNSSRGSRPWRTFAAHVAAYLNRGVTAEAIIAHIRARIAVEPDLAAARALIERRGGFTAALRSAARAEIS